MSQQQAFKILAPPPHACSFHTPPSLSEYLAVVPPSSWQWQCSPELLEATPLAPAWLPPFPESLEPRHQVRDGLLRDCHMSRMLPDTGIITDLPLILSMLAWMGGMIG